MDFLDDSIEVTYQNETDKWAREHYEHQMGHGFHDDYGESEVCGVCQESPCICVVIDDKQNQAITFKGKLPTIQVVSPGAEY